MQRPASHSDVQMQDRGLEALRKDGDIVVWRGWRMVDGDDCSHALAVVPEPLYPTLDSLNRLAHEYGLKDELDGAWAARPLALVQHEGRTILLLEDPGGEPLDRLLGTPMELGLFLRLAVGLAAVLRELHARGLVHKDIKPAHVLVDVASGRVWLTGFGIASRLRRERQAVEPPEVIAGTLAYMAPEQTGRMNRSIDTRSDLYSLGITLYEMVIGGLPFLAADPMEWVHCHIARRPVPPAERRPELPGVVSAIVMKLLAKTAEERYQTAAGLESDLRRCLADWEAQHRIDDFRLGDHDTPDRLLIPEKLYGRAREIETLLSAFDRVVRSGTPELVLVSGYSGIGKSSVVNELHKVLVPPRGLFASGKFDQYKRDIPYATLAQAFQSLIRPLLGKSEAGLAAWRDALQEALGANARLIVALVPEVKLIIGEPPPVPELSPQDAQRRVQLVFRRFIGVFARPEHPLALFLDDLQWLDAATLDLIEDLLTQPDTRHLMLIGAYRDNEVGVSHPLVRKLTVIRQAGAAVQEIRLGPLGHDDLAQLIADAVRCEPVRAAPLAQLVQEKTGGNPFFAIQFLAALAEQELLGFDHGKGEWFWNLDRIHAKGYTDNVVDLMVGKLTRLAVETQKALQQLACLGSVAAPRTLSLLLGTCEEKVHADLWEAARSELIERTESAYRFVHDRVQEAAYSLIPEELRPEAHLRIGRQLVAETPPEQQEEAIFEIVNQLNRGAALIAGPEERAQLAEFNLMAGKRAKASSAYASALTHFIAGAALLAEDAWERRHHLTFALELHRAECEFLTGELAAAEARLSTLWRRAGNLSDLAAITCLRMPLYTTLDKSDRAIEVGLEYLRRVGIAWSPHPTDEEVAREFEEMWRGLGSRPVEALIDLPPMSDPTWCGTMDVFAQLLPAAVFTNRNLHALIIARMANVSLEHGNAAGSCFAYVWLGMLLGPQFGDYEAGFRFGQLSVDLLEKRGLLGFKARVYLGFGHVVPWTRHVRTGVALAQTAMEAAQQTGDVSFANIARGALITHLLSSGEPLQAVQREAETALEFAEKARFGVVADTIRGQLRLIMTLRGLTPDFGCFTDHEFDQGQFEEHLQGDPRLTYASWRYWIRKLQARWYAADYASAIAAAAQAERLLSPSFLAYFEVAEYHFYAALARTAYVDAGPADQRSRYLDLVSPHHRQLEMWAHHCPHNFENRAALVRAEIARIEGRELDAERAYEQAIRSARANGFLQNEALAYELAARFYSARGFEQIADLYLRNARHCYLRWGADGKVRQLDELHPHLRTGEPPRDARGTIGAPIEHLELATVLTVSQAVSGEMAPEKVVEMLLRTALEHAGAERGLLVLPRHAELRIEAEANTDDGGGSMRVRLRDAPVATGELPESVVRYAARTQESVILEDASAANPFSDDEYIRRSRSRSVLCLPLVKQGRLVALLYLENNLAPRVFTPARMAVMKLLASEAAVALDNSRLYRELQEREARIRRLVDSNIVGVVISSLDGRVLEANDAFLAIVGYTRDHLTSGRISWTELTPPEWHAASQQAVEQIRATGSCGVFEKEYFRQDGSRVPVLVTGAAIGDSGSEAVSFVLDLREHKRAEVERREHLWFLESMDRINRAMQGSNDLEQMMSDVLDAVLAIFDCDRTWLVHPCDPLAPRWRVAMELTRPQFPGAFALGNDLPVDPEVTTVFETALHSGGAVRFDPESAHRVPVQLAARFTIQSMIAMVVSPKIGQPYLFGLHQCSGPRVWTPTEERLLQEIGRRLEDALTNVLIFRSLRESERRLEEAQRIAHVGYWDRDLVAGRITLSDEGCRIFGLQPEDRVVDLTAWDERWQALIHPEDRARAAEAAAAALRGGPRYDVEYRVVHRTGEVRIVHSQGDVIWDESGRPCRMFGIMQDITERKRAEEALWRSEAYLAEGQRLSHAGSWAWNPFTEQCFYWSEEMFRIFDIDQQQGLPTSEVFWSRIHPEDRESMRELLWKSALEKTEYVHDHRIVLPDGTVKHIHAIGHPVLDKAGELVEYVGTIVDATDRKRAEQALRETQAYLAEAQRLSHTGSWAFNVAGNRYLYVSEEGLRIFELDAQQGFPTREAVSRLIHPEDWNRVNKDFETSLREKVDTVSEFRIVLPSGTIKHIQAVRHPVMNDAGDVVKLVGTVVDVTERTLNEQRLTAQHSVARILAEAATIEEATPKILQAVCESLGWDLGALWDIDREAGVLRCAELWRKPSVEATRFEAATRTRAFRPGSGLPGRVWVSRAPACVPDVVHDPEFLRADIAAREGLHAAFAFPILLGNEVLGVIDFASRDIRQADRDLLDMMASIGSQIGQFIERKRAERALYEAQANMAHVTRVTTLGELAASIAHEVNQPLSGVVSNASASLRWLAGEPPNLDKAREAAQRIVRDGKRAAEVIARVRAMTRSAATPTEKLDLNETIQEVLALIGDEAKRNSVIMQTRFADDVFPVLGDRVQLQQVVLNLIMNGIEAMSSIGERARELVITTRNLDPDRVQVTVDDLGTGLAPNTTARIFEPFYTTKPGGMGMGLSISRSIVQAHGGQLWAAAKDGPGTIFHFTLPKYDEKESHAGSAGV